MSNILEEAETLIAKCWGEYKEEIPQREIMNGFAMLPQLVAEIKRLRKCFEKCSKSNSKLYIELARWQQLAIEEAAKGRYNAATFGVFPGWDDQSKEARQIFREQAAKELQLEAANRGCLVIPREY